MTKKYPKLKFVISKKKELDAYLAFLEDGKYRDNSREMDWAFYQPHPKLQVLKDRNLSLNQRKAIVKKYIYDFYKKYLKGIIRRAGKAKKSWRKVEKNFYKLTDKIFGEYKWPKGKYIAYPTIWGMYPRFLEDKTFQFPPGHKKQNYIRVIIAHEMLHFIFYDYVYKKSPKLKSHKYDFDLWNISEAFNAVIQNSPKWVKAFNQKTMIYPEHRDLIRKLRKIWKETNGDIDSFFKESLKYDSNKKIQRTT